MLAPLEPINGITSRIIKCAIEVHRIIGPGLLENVYAACLIHELTLEGLRFQRESSVPWSTGEQFCPACTGSISWSKISWLWS